ncbi:MAG: hypothetical protein SGJ20_01115 [Planctomycetota bacterium]|nr:hypothetical protein [Planctomycetota bacterium]
MARHHFVRVGAMGHVGRFTAVDAVQYPRASRVVLRTGRGLELGEILGPAEELSERGSADGSILRGMTVEDQLLEARLEKNRQAAFKACVAKLRDLRQPAMSAASASGESIQTAVQVGPVLMDVEHLFDGQSLYFYFLGEVSAEVEAITAELAEAYDATVKFSKFAESLSEGCGPGCGTAESAGQGCTSCSTGCAIAGACGSKK